MTPAQFNFFCDFRDSFKSKIKEWSCFNEELRALQKQAADDAKTPSYEIETPIVYNTALDEITEDSIISLIVIGDNPGKNEQLKQNKKYLVGQAGKLGEGFFSKNPVLGIDFRKNAVILNKTPVHSAKTNQLKFIKKNASPALQKMLVESELWMARETAKLHIGLCENASCPGNCAVCGGQNHAAAPIAPQLWLVGYAELKGKGLFLPYRDELLSTYKTSKNSGKAENPDTIKSHLATTPLVTFHEAWNYVFVYQHFSMNRFSIDLNEFCKNQATNTGKKLSLADKLQNLGKLHRQEIFGI